LRNKQLASNFFGKAEINMKTTYKYAYLFLTFYLLLFGVSCELFDEKTCDYTRDEIEDWYSGYAFTYQFDPTSIISDEGRMEKIYLGPYGTLLKIDNICTSEPVTVSATLEAKNGGLDEIYKAYLIISNEFGDQSWSYPRAITLARTNTEAGNNTLEVQNVEIPAFPNFQSDNYAGSIQLGILINNIDRICAEEDAKLVAENWLNYFIEKATITVSYTEY
jgi:hypothetical protein